MKFTMSDGPSFTLPEHVAQKVIDSSGQLIKIPNDKGEWTGQTINKAHIISTDRDRDAERDWNRDQYKRLPEAKEIITPEQQRNIEKRRKEISDMLRWGKKPSNFNRKSTHV